MRSRPFHSHRQKVVYMQQLPLQTLLSAVAATGAGTSLETAGYGVASFQVTGTFSATVTWQGSNDNSNWVSIPARKVADDAVATTATATGIYIVNTQGVHFIRPNVTAYTSGSVTVKGTQGEQFPGQPGVTLKGSTGAHGSSAPGSGVVVAGYDGTSIRFLRMANADSISAGSLLAVVPTSSDGDRWRSNLEGTLLASAARTATAAAASQTNYNARGVIVHLNVTIASGTGGLSVRIQAYDPIVGDWWNINTSPTVVTATGKNIYAVYPGASGGTITQTTSQVLPRTWRVSVIHSDGSSYTYSVAYSLVL